MSSFQPNLSLLSASSLFPLLHVYHSCKKQPVWSNTDKLDGGKVWKVKCAGNPMTFESIYNSNHTTDVFAVESARTKAADAAWEQLKA